MLETVKVKNESKAGFVIINKTDLTKDHEIYGEKSPEQIAEEKKTKAEKAKAKKEAAAKAKAEKVGT